MYIYITNPLLFQNIDSVYLLSLVYIYIINRLLLRSINGA